MMGYLCLWHSCPGSLCLFLPLLESLFVILASPFEPPFFYKVARKYSPTHPINIQMTKIVDHIFHSTWATGSKEMIPSFCKIEW